MPIAQGQSKAADALVKLSRCAPPGWQATTGLQWIEEVIGSSFTRIADRCYHLAQWLEDTRTALPADADRAR
jgi:hypothetical protein